MNSASVAILWDTSYLWGLMAHRAMESLGVPHGFIMAQEIAQGALFRKRPGILLVPGGSARRKADALGRRGLEAIRAWVGEGGFYLGFCGGAGLALTSESNEGMAQATGEIGSLGLCPWHRKIYRHRLYHLISGHVTAETAAGDKALPVWWPGRFEEESHSSVNVLARYKSPCSDLWLADLPLAMTPDKILRQWHDRGLVDASRAIVSGQPLVIEGAYGRGSYLLSYAHLETPDSPEANGWLVQILQEKGHIAPLRTNIPPWRLRGISEATEEPEKESPMAAWPRIMRLGQELGFFFERTPWLAGWRRGAPGMACNHLLAGLDVLERSCQGKEPASNSWLTLERSLNNFIKEAENCFWNLRLESILEEKSPPALTGKEAAGLFGHPMSGGGEIQRLLAALESILYDELQNQLAG